MNTEDNLDVAIVGGGVAGLTAAVLLARAGKRVALFERGSGLGGRAATRERAGACINFGPHALYRTGHAMRVMRQLGIAFSGKIPVVNRQSVALFEGQQFLFPSSAGTMVTTDLFSTGEKLRAMVASGRLRLGRSTPAGQSWQQWVEQESDDVKLRHFLYAAARVATYCHMPAQSPAAVVLEQVQLALAGNVLYLDGGWQQWMGKLTDLALESGVELHCGSRVTAIERYDERFVLRFGGGAPQSATNLLLAVPPTGAAQLLPESDSLQQRLQRLTPARMATLNVALHSTPQPARTFGLGIDIPLYYSLHSASARLAAPGAAVLHVARYLAPTEAVDAQAVREELETWLDELQPGWRQQTAFAEFLPQMTVMHDTPAVGVQPQTVQIEDTPGVWLAGDWIGERGLLADRAVASAEEAVAAILRSGQ